MWNLIGCEEMNVRVDGTGRRNQPFAGDHLGAGADHQIRIDAILDLGVAGLTDADDQSVLDADVGLHDAEHRVHDDHRANDEIEDAVGVAAAGNLAHTVAHDFAAAVDGFLAGQHEAPFDAGNERRVGEPEAITLGRAIKRRVRLPRDGAHRAKPPLTRLLKPITRLLPPKSTRSTSRSSPASKRIDCPAGTSRRMPSAASRSNSSARLTSEKWKCEPTWIGLSPVLRTESLRVRRPALISIGS